MKELYLLMTIVRRSDAEEYEKFFRDNGLPVIYNTHCHGTTQEKTLSLLGIDKTEKTLLMVFLTKNSLKKIIDGLTRQMKIDLPGRGISVAVPLSGIGGVKALEYFAGPDAVAEDESGTKTTQEEKVMQTSHELIMAIYEKGYTDIVMDAAREAGAAGGTTIRSKGTGGRGTEMFFGLALAEEKEIVLIVAQNKNKKEIMKSIMQKAGMGTKAHALVFSLPVTETAGFKFTETIERDD